MVRVAFFQGLSCDAAVKELDGKGVVLAGETLSLSWWVLSSRNRSALLDCAETPRSKASNSASSADPPRSP